MPDTVIYTIGHSNHEIGAFLALLAQHGIEELADVRSSPYSKMYPQFSREALSRALAGAGVRYSFFGKELGARTTDASCYEAGKVSYVKLARTAPFQRGLAQVVADAGERRVALMCAEKDPLTCHRTILVARELAPLGVGVQHILADGAIEPHEAALSRLLDVVGLPQEDLFLSREELIAEAHAIQGAKIAYTTDELPGASLG
jgi:uncharacterized protein (DUF488 family)